MAHASDELVYLIEADEAVRDSLKVLLESHDITVRDFHSAAEFVVQGGPSAGGCLVLGYNRLIAEGLELVATLRRRGIELPVIFMVGGGNASTRAAALASGAFIYLERPIDETAIIHAIRTALIRQRSRGASGGSSLSASPPATPAPSHG